MEEEIFMREIGGLVPNCPDTEKAVRKRGRLPETA